MFHNFQVRDRYISEEDDYEDRLLREKSDQRLYDKKHARVRTREKDGTKSERSSGLTFGLLKFFFCIFRFPCSIAIYYMGIKQLALLDKPANYPSLNSSY